MWCAQAMANRRRRNNARVDEIVNAIHSIRQRPEGHISLLAVPTRSVGDSVEDEFGISSPD